MFSCKPIIYVNFVVTTSFSFQYSSRTKRVKYSIPINKRTFNSDDSLLIDIVSHQNFLSKKSRYKCVILLDSIFNTTITTCPWFRFFTLYMMYYYNIPYSPIKVQPTMAFLCLPGIFQVYLKLIYFYISVLSLILLSCAFMYKLVVLVSSSFLTVIR